MLMLKPICSAVRKLQLQRDINIKYCFKLLLQLFHCVTDESFSHNLLTSLEELQELLFRISTIKSYKIFILSMFLYKIFTVNVSKNYLLCCLFVLVLKFFC